MNDERNDEQLIAQASTDVPGSQAGEAELPEEGDPIVVLETTDPEDGKRKAAVLWGIREEDVDVRVIDEEKRLFGFLGTKFKIEARPVAPLAVLNSTYFLNALTARMEVDIRAVLSEDNVIELTGDDAGIIIGRYGETLKSLEYLSNLIFHKMEDPERIRLDCGGYRERVQANLAKIARGAAREAVSSGQPVTLDPMSSWERRFIHLTLQDRQDVETRSSGNDPFRRVVIWPKDTASEGAGSRKFSNRRRSPRRPRNRSSDRPSGPEPE